MTTRSGLEEVRAVLSRTPGVLRGLLQGLPDDWTSANEGKGTWSPFDVVGHLIHGEETDWIPRMRLVLEHGEGRAFEPFDRFAQEEKSRGKTLAELLDTFAALRGENLATLESTPLTPEDLERRGTHPELGGVTLRELLSTWAAHDLVHVAQVSRVLARRFDIGPWRDYVRVLGGAPDPP